MHKLRLSDSASFSSLLTYAFRKGVISVGVILVGVVMIYGNTPFIRTHNYAKYIFDLKS